MDFLDPKRRRRHAIILLTGYVFITIAIIFALRILYLIAYGYGLGKDGNVVQNGLVFVASTPSGAQINLNNVPNKAKTNARLSLVSGMYNMTLSRDGYRSWQQTFSLEGSSVERLDYPFLFPTSLSTKQIKKYEANPQLATQSPDRRWLLVKTPASQLSFDLYDLKSLTAAPTPIAIPAAVLSNGATQSWTLVEWADDNVHVLLSHIYDGKNEYILVDRTDPAKTLNLNQTLAVNPTKITLLNKKYDQYYLYDAATQQLQNASLGAPTPVPYLENVLAYQTYGSNVVLYASSKTATNGKVAIDLFQDNKSHLLREVTANSTYLLNLTQYNGSWYVAAGASSENKVYIYKNPVTQLNSRLGVLVPIYVLKTANPNFLAFSANARFIMDENGSNFSVYDAEYDKGYRFDTQAPLDVPQAHASWMDGHRLDYVSAGKLLVFDFNSTNKQTLVAANPAYVPFFSPDYKYVNLLAPGKDSPQALNRTPLRTTEDL